MRFKALTMAAAVAGTLAFAATPASAAANWKEVSTNSNWNCSDYKPHPVSSYVKFKVCLVINASDDAQAVLVVQNTTGGPITIGGAVRSDFGSNVDCANSTLNTSFTRGCFAPTVTDAGSRSILNATGYLTVNGVTASVSNGIGHV
ncbi:hypothetical protein Sipo8835_12360 [Streptomyces ipomoeae]|jgi:hypothetical protein|uniref:Secreted protein n=1 Tax=Streptomyces ipomoeae TaxID=103232 RepID=A0AAE9B1P2_9ACTN|nr:hypothetical protein [Streptomyces ipomoeae]TQE35819.1 hypothetical protein Sipo8835_12360 [Streptomyces ipomoeae]